LATVTMTMEEYEALMELVRSVNRNDLFLNPEAKGPGPLPESGNKPKKRKRSKYNRELSKQLKMLKKKHPRTAVTKLMKKAHRATKKALK